MISVSYADHAWEMASQLLSIDSPTGFTEKAASWVKDTFTALGFDARITTKGGWAVTTTAMRCCCLPIPTP